MKKMILEVAILIAVGALSIDWNINSAKAAIISAVIVIEVLTNLKR